MAKFSKSQRGLQMHSQTRFQDTGLRHHPSNLKADKFKAIRRKLLITTIKLVTSRGSKDKMYI